jgi:anti-sigma factor RsiW
MNRRDIELLSAYLDGELKPSELARMESRLKSDPELESEMKSMRATRTLLHKLPSRKAPRNFTLTRKMAGQNPPLPRTYPIFRLATMVATLLFFFSIGINSFGAQMASQSVAYGIGGSGGGGDTESFAEQAAPAMEAPAAPPAIAEEPAAPEPEAYATDSASGEESSLDAVGTAPTDDAARIVEPSSSKTGETENAVETDQFQATQEASPLVPSTWQIALVVIALLGLLFMFFMRYTSARRWK